MVSFPQRYRLQQSTPSSSDGWNMPKLPVNIVKLRHKSNPGSPLSSSTLTPSYRMLSLNLVGASFLCLQKNTLQYFPSSSPPREEDWGTVIAETKNCIYVAYPTCQVSPDELPQDGETTVAQNLENDNNSPAFQHSLHVRKYIKESSIFAFTSIDGVYPLCHPPSHLQQQSFPICVVHGKQHLPHLLQNHSSRLLS